MWLALSLPLRRGSLISWSGTLPEAILSWARYPRALPWNLLVPRLVTRLIPRPPAWTLRSLPPVVTVISWNAPKSKYVGDAPVADMSVMASPSRFHILSLVVLPLPAAEACWPFSLPAMLTRSRSTPGTFLSTPQGSRALGTLLSSSDVMVVAVPRFLTSTSGVSAVTVTVSATLATFRENATFTFSPVVTVTSRVTLVKPRRLTVILYWPRSRPMKRKSPWALLVVDRLPRSLDRATVAPGNTAPESSVTVP